MFRNFSTLSGAGGRHTGCWESNSYCPAVCKVNPTYNTVAPVPFKTVFSFSYLGEGVHIPQYSVVTPVLHSEIDSGRFGGP